MERAVEKGTGKQRAQRLHPADELDPFELEELAGDALAAIQSGNVQYWRVNDVLGVFSTLAIEGVWDVRFSTGDEGGDNLADEVKAILNGFWDAEKPEYIMVSVAAVEPALSFLQGIGFQQVGVIPLLSGPVIQMGWRKCH